MPSLACVPNMPQGTRQDGKARYPEPQLSAIDDYRSDKPGRSRLQVQQVYTTYEALRTEPQVLRMMVCEARSLSYCEERTRLYTPSMRTVTRMAAENVRQFALGGR